MKESNIIMIFGRQSFSKPFRRSGKAVVEISKTMQRTQRRDFVITAKNKHKPS
jgi:hypothetical protein